MAFRILAIVVTATCFLCPLASASVVVTGTRVIYPGDAREIAVNLTNQDPFTNIVQAWADAGDPESTPDTADAPFLITPPVFRMSAGAGQSLRIMYTGNGLPVDRESVFYLNVRQIPPTPEDARDRNRLIITQSHRLKLFYRPAGVEGLPDDMPGQLGFSLRETDGTTTVRVDNPTGYYASLANCRLIADQHTIAVRSSMVAPKSQADWQIAQPLQAAAGKPTLRCVLVNDYGAIVEIERQLAAQ